MIQDRCTLTEQWRQLVPAIPALTRFGLARLRPLAGTATVYRPSFAAYPLHARPDAATSVAGAFLSVTDVDSEPFCSCRDQRGHVVTWAGHPGAEPNDAILADTITAMSLAAGLWTVAQALSQGQLSF